MKPGSERCEVCDVAIAPKGRRRHELTAEHQDAEPLFHASRAAEAQARKDGLERLVDFDFAPFDPNARPNRSAGHDRVTPALDALGIPVVALPTGFHHGTRYSHRYDELWTESWAASIVNWKGVDVATRTRALNHVAADPSLREYLRDWPTVSRSAGHVVGLELSASTRIWIFSPGVAHLTIVLNPLDRRKAVESWNFAFDVHGQITGFETGEFCTGEKLDDVPPLHVMIQVQGAINELARCSAVIRWLAGAA
jgi:hypothetical protein